MDFHKQLSLIAVAMLLSSGAHAAIKLKLSGTGDPSDGYGYQGLYLGYGFSQSHTDPDNNWSWTNFDMTIDSNGDAVIQGIGINNGNKDTGNGTNVNGSWNISISLSDIEFKDANGNYRDGGNWSGNVTNNMITDLFSGKNPFGNDDWSDNSYDSWGFEWKHLSMTIDDIDESTWLDNNTWKGFAMPSIGHLNVAELHYNDGGVRYDAWYKNKNCFDYDGCSYVDRKFKVGDSKADAYLDVPEPGSLVLMGIGLLGIGGRRITRLINR